MVPNFNHAHFLRQCIEGILGQSHKDLELIIVDDGSTDESWAIIEDSRKRDGRVVAERFDQNKGANAAAKRGVSISTGELLYCTAADDFVSDNRFFELVVSSLAKHPSVAGAFGISRVTDSEGKDLWEMGRYGSVSCQHISAQEVISAFFSGKLFIPGASAIWKRVTMDELGGYDEALGPQSDYYLNHGIAMTHGVVAINEVVSTTRASPSSFSSATDDETFFRRHALVEQKWRSLPNGAALPRSGLREWRHAVINGRLSYDRQVRLVELAKATFADVKEWERAGFQTEFIEAEVFLRDRCERLGMKLEASRARAQRIFEEVAGPLRA